MEGNLEASNESAPDQAGAKVSPARWAAGCLVILASILGGVVSSKMVNEDFAKVTHAEDQNVSLLTANPPAPSSPNLAEDRSSQVVPQGHCITLDGKQFEWHWANVPFASMSCSQ